MCGSGPYDEAARRLQELYESGVSRKEFDLALDREVDNLLLQAEDEIP